MRCTRCGEDVGPFTRQFKQPYGLLGVCDPCWMSLRNHAWMAYRKARKNLSVVPANQCQDCGRSDRPLTGHHWSYVHPLEVHWLCSASCHAARHRRDEKEWRAYLDSRKVGSSDMGVAPGVSEGLGNAGNYPT